MDTAPRRTAVQTLLASALLFALFASYGILRPLRDNVGQCFGRWRITDIWLGTALVTLASTTLLGFAVTRWPRRKFAPWAFALCAAITGAAYLAWQAHGGTPNVEDPVGFWLAAGFYWWVSSYLPFGLALFWGLMADLHHEAMGRRLFGIIAVGGTLGQLAGAQFTTLAAKPLGLLPLLAVAVVLLVACTVLCAVLLRTAAPSAGTVPGDAAPAADRAGLGGHWWDGFAACARSPFLAAILGYVALQTFLSAVLSLEIIDIVRAHFGNGVEEQNARTAFNARIDFWSQAATLVFQFALVGPLMTRAGVGVTLALQPLVFALGLLALLFVGNAPSLIFAVAALDMARRSVNYGFAKPSRDVLFTVCSPDEKYKAKSAIDAAAWRMFDWLSAVATNGWRAAVGGLGGTVAIAVPVALGWAWLAGRLGVMHRRRAVVGR